MAFQPRINRALRRRMRLNAMSQLQRRGRRALDTQGDGLQPFGKQPGVERAQRRACMAQERLKLGLQKLLGREHSTTQAAALPVDMLRCGIDDDIRAELGWTLHDRTGEGIVDDEFGAAGMRQFRQRLEIQQRQGRVRRRFDEDQFGVRTDGPFPRREIRPIDQSGARGRSAGKKFCKMTVFDPNIERPATT